MNATLEGNCVVCKKWLDADAYRREEVCNLFGTEGSIVFCSSHVMGGPGNAEYEKTLEQVALAKIAQLQKQ